MTYAAGVRDSSDCKLTILEALLLKIKVSREAWLRKVLKSGLRALDKCQETGGSCATHDSVQLCVYYYLRKIPTGRKLLITSSADGRCFQRKFLEESTKHTKSLDTLFEENTLHEAKVYLDIKQRYNVLMLNAVKRQINEVKWTYQSWK